LTMDIREMITGKSAEPAKPAEETTPKTLVVDETKPEVVPTEEPKGRQVKFNKEAKFVPEAEVDTYIQKGLHLETVQKRLDETQAKLLRAAKVNGHESVEGYLKSLDDKEQEVIQQSIEDAYGDPDKLNTAIKQHPLVKQAAELAERASREAAKATLKGNRFYNELEPELDKVLDANPGVDPEVAYDFLIGKMVRDGKLDELIAQAKDNAKKSATADIQDQARRGSPKGSATTQETVTLTARGKDIANIFGVDPAKVAQRMKR